MIFGLEPFVFVHVLISLVAIVAGVIVVGGILSSRRMGTWTLVFLVLMAATTASGFGLFAGLTPAFFVGLLTSLALLMAVGARYTFHLEGAWRWIYVIGAVVALYLSVFVLVAQLFLKISPLHVLAPNGTEPPFAIAQGVVLLAFIAIGYYAVKRFHPAAPAA